MPEASVAIPIRDGGAPLADTLAALAAQSVEHELIVYDSGSRDGSVDLARSHGARVLEIPSSSFAHGRVRNLLMRETKGERVALLSQDAEPADERWLERMLSGFDLAPDVALVYGPYRPRPTAPLAVRLELEHWFASLSPDGEPRLERLPARERSLPAVELVGRRGFFTDANACLAREAWERVPYRDLPYAEDRALALDMLRAGYAKAFLPDAAVLHSHDYTAIEQLRRCFDEWRGLLEVYGWREPVSPAHLLRQLRAPLAHAREELIREGVSTPRRWATLTAVIRHHVIRLAGAALGSRADRLAPGVRRRLSLDGRADFAPLEVAGDPLQPLENASSR
jgi:rhamnosyltransferase